MRAAYERFQGGAPALRVGKLFADEPRRVDIASVDPVEVIDLPTPASIHRLGGGVRLDRFVSPRPTTNNGPVIEECGFEREVGLPERLAEQQ